MTGGVDLTKAITRILIAILCGAALRLIVTILSGSKFDQTSAKAIATAASFAIFSLTGIAGLNLRERRDGEALFGYMVAGVSLAAFLVGVVDLWSEAQGDSWEIPGILSVLALGGGHASLLLKDSGTTDADSVRAIRASVLLTIAVLCTMAVSEISSDGRQIDPRAFGVLAVLYLLGTVVLPLVRRNLVPAAAAAGSPPASAPELLRAHGHVLVEGPVARGGVHGGGENVCLREPDGTLIEVITYRGG